ncbi:unnamed protein product, partial [Didymodactylos carnosus]
MVRFTSQEDFVLLSAILQYDTNDWQLIAAAMNNYLLGPSVIFKTQYDQLCETYEHLWRKSDEKSDKQESFNSFLYSKVKAKYYNELCDRVLRDRHQIYLVIWELLRHVYDKRLIKMDIVHFTQQLHLEHDSNDPQIRQQLINKKEQIIERAKAFLADKWVFTQSNNSSAVKKMSNVLDSYSIRTTATQTTMIDDDTSKIIIEEVVRTILNSATAVDEDDDIVSHAFTKAHDIGMQERIDDVILTKKDKIIRKRKISISDIETQVIIVPKIPAVNSIETDIANSNDKTTLI